MATPDFAELRPAINAMPSTNIANHESFRFISASSPYRLNWIALLHGNSASDIAATGAILGCHQTSCQEECQLRTAGRKFHHGLIAAFLRQWLAILSSNGFSSHFSSWVYLSSCSTCVCAPSGHRISESHDHD